MFKKIAVTILISLNLALLLAIPLTHAQEAPETPEESPTSASETTESAPNTENPNSTDSASSNSTSTNQPPAVEKKPFSTTNFPINDYLTAEGQGKKYFESNNPIGSFIVQIINFLVMTIGSLTFLCLVIGGFILLTSGGNENSVNKGKEIITYSLIGLAIVFGAYIIISFAQSIFYELPTK